MRDRRAFLYFVGARVEALLAVDEFALGILTHGAELPVLILSARLPRQAERQQQRRTVHLRKPQELLDAEAEPMVSRRRARKHNRAHDGDGVAVDKHSLAAEVEKGNGARKLRRQPQPFAIGLEFGHQDARHLAALLLGARRLAREQPHVLHADDVRLNLLSGARFFEDTLVVAVYVDDVEERHGVCGEVWGRGGTASWQRLLRCRATSRRRS